MESITQTGQQGQCFPGIWQIFMVTRVLKICININLEGTAGQSFGAFTSYGITFNLAGEANDYVGKGLCGGQINIFPPEDSKVVPEESIIVGNTVLYGAIAGQCYFRGIGGERFAVKKFWGMGCYRRSW